MHIALQGRRWIPISAGAGLAAAAGAAASTSAPTAVALVVVSLFTTLFLVGSVSVPFLAVAGTWVSLPLPLGVASLTAADILLICGAASAVVQMNWERAGRLKPIFVGVLLLLCTSSLPLVIVPTLGGFAEIAHRGVIVISGVLVGAFLAQRRRFGAALTVFVLLSVIVSIAATAQSLASHFNPAYPFGLNKNYVGSLLSSAFLVCYALRPRPDQGRWGLRVCQLILAAGVLAAQSRGAIVGLVLGTMVWAFLTQRSRGLSALLVFLCVPIMAWSISQDLTAKPVFGSSAVHLTYAQTAVGVWLQSPLFGNSVFIYGDDRGGAYDGHNVVLLTLDESGVVGLAGLIALMVATIVALRRRNTFFASTVLALTVARFAHGLVDVYWVHGSQALPWLAVGMALCAGAVVPQFSLAPDAENQETELSAAARPVAFA